MKLQHIITLQLTEKELKEAILMHLDCDRNDCVPNSPEWIRRTQIIDHIHDNAYADLDWGEDGLFYVTIDGLLKTEDF